MKNKRNHRISALILFLSLILAACAQPNAATIAPSETPAPTISPAKLIPTPDAETAVIFGRLLSKKTGGAPMTAVYLAKNISEGKENIPAMLSFSYQTSPRALIDDEGYFNFSEVPEGSYAITLFNPAGNNYFVTDETGNDYLWIHAVPGETLDMGTLNVP